MAVFALTYRSTLSATSATPPPTPHRSATWSRPTRRAPRAPDAQRISPAVRPRCDRVIRRDGEAPTLNRSSELSVLGLPPDGFERASLAYAESLRRGARTRSRVRRRRSGHSTRWTGRSSSCHAWCGAIRSGSRHRSVARTAASRARPGRRDRCTSLSADPECRPRRDARRLDSRLSARGRIHGRAPRPGPVAHRTSSFAAQ